ncbi:L-rhamnose mutarotase [Polaribacter sp. L3A8]|uniref:L-rhamnose mutarotase n=1 Tax=Polaribacter sp. L3A8 TaxID=2686361 RepID=UPI00131EC8C7|nr:L-rhamnose mutarotase [Polaribacter sp. L3A8]
MKERLAFKMKLKEGKQEEYYKRHNAIWPELKLLLKQTGISEYSIFFDEESNSLFAFQKVELGASSQDLSENPIVKKWWDFMADIMEVASDNSPISKELKEVFYLE